MSRSIPNNNIYEIDTIYHVPYKNLRNHLVNKIYNNQINYYKSLSRSDLNKLINNYKNEYNNLIRTIKMNDNKVSEIKTKRYNRLLINLIAAKDYLNNTVQENDINLIDHTLVNKYKDKVNVDYNNTELFNKDENIFYDNANSEYNKLINEVRKYHKIESINDLLEFTKDSNSTNSQMSYSPQITFLNDKTNYSNNNFKKESILKLIESFKKIDKAIEEFNNFIEYFENGNTIYSNQFNEILENIIEMSRLFKYYHITDVSKEQLYPIHAIYYIGYSDEFNNMLFEDFNDKLQLFKKENKNIKDDTFMIFRYYYENDVNKYHDTPLNDTNYLSPENILSGKSMKETLEETGKSQGSDSEITSFEEPIANEIYSFEFFNIYEASLNDMNNILKEMDIDYDNSESAGIKELTRINNNVSKIRINREGQLFTYKINTSEIEKYFKDYSKIIIKCLNRLQIFEEFNGKRIEYNYNCLIYSIFVWFRDNINEEFAKKICLDLMCFNFSRFVTLKDITVINKYFRDNAKYLGKRYKIKVYRQNDVLQQVKANCKDDKKVDYYIPIVLLETEKMNKIEINHFMLYERIDFKKYLNNSEDQEKLLKAVNKLKSKNSKNNNWTYLNSYILVKYLLENEDYKFFIPFTFEELNEILDEKDELKNKIKEKELYQMINEMSNYDISILQEKAFKKVKNIINSKFNNKKFDDVNEFISEVVLNNKNYEYLCFYDFESSTHEKDSHKAYMVCYSIIKFPKKILSEDELKEFIKDFNKNYKIITIHGYSNSNQNNNNSQNSNKNNNLNKDCAERFLKAIPDKTLCYAHNVKYDLSFFDYSKIDIEESCEKDGNLYSRDIIFEGKHITFKDSYKLITSKLSKFPEMFALGDIQKEVFPYNFYTIDNLNKYKNINFKLGSKEFEVIENDLIQGFNEINQDKKNKAYNEFREIIKNKFNGIFNMRRYSKFYCERDVELLFKGLISMRTYVYKITALDCLKYLTISTIAHRHMINNVYTKTNKRQDDKILDFSEDLYTTSGILNQYIQSSVWGGVCTSYENSKILVKRVVSDFDAVSLYTSAMKRLYIVTGKCKKFSNNELDMINNSMNVDGNYNNKNCWLLKNTNSEKENDRNKINMYIVTIRIKDSKKKRSNPRIVVKNEMIGPKIKKYPNLPVGNIMVNVDKNADLNDYRYKYYYVNECIVTIDNIMLEDYIKYHDIEFEVLCGIYWKDNNKISLLDCFLNYSTKIRYSKDLNQEDSIKYSNVLDNKLNDKPELKNFYEDAVNRYEEIRENIKKLVKGSKRIEDLSKTNQNKIRNEYKKIEKIKDEINELDEIIGDTHSSKHTKIQDVMQQLFDARLKYKNEGNPLEQVIKLLLNSVYGKTIQKPTTKKINYIRLISKNVIDLKEKPEHTQKYILREYNKFKENYISNLKDKYYNNQITKDEYKSKMNSLDKIVNISKDKIFSSYYSPVLSFLENNKNKIIGMDKINNNMYRIETIEQIENHKSFNHVGVQILSMSKRIMNEVICTAQDLKFNVYYQDTDSIHIEYKNIPELAKEFKKKYNRDLIGKGLGQFHSDFEPCKIKNGSKPEITLSKLLIINGKKNYIDVKFNPACYFKNFDIDNDFNICLDKVINDELNVIENIVDNYHIRMKGVNKTGVIATSEELNINFEELYLKIFNGCGINFNLSKAKPSFQFTKYLTVVSKELERFIKTEGNRIIFNESQREFKRAASPNNENINENEDNINGISIYDNEWNRNNVEVDINGNIKGIIKNSMF